MNHKRVHRVYREAGLSIRRKKRKHCVRHQLYGRSPKGVLLSPFPSGKHLNFRHWMHLPQGAPSAFSIGSNQASATESPSVCSREKTRSRKYMVKCTVNTMSICLIQCDSTPDTKGMTAG